MLLSSSLRLFDPHSIQHSNMFGHFARQLTTAATDADAKKVMSPTLRADVYSAVDQAKSWVAGGQGGGQAGDGVSYGPILAIIQKHFPATKIGLESVGNVESEVAIIVGGVTNMILEFSKWEGMAGGMAIRTWVDALVDAHAKAVVSARSVGAARKDMVAKGITKGLNQNTDITLMTKEFTSKIQIISCLKSVSSRIYGAGTDEARQGEAVWSSRFI